MNALRQNQWRWLTILAIVLLFAAILYFGWYIRKPVLQIFGFAFALVTGHVNFGPIPEPKIEFISVIYRLYLFFAGFMLVSVPYLFFLRWLFSRESVVLRKTLAILTGILYFFPFCLLTKGFIRLVFYTAAMGFTPKRAAGLLLGLAGYAVLAAIVLGLIRSLQKRNP